MLPEIPIPGVPTIAEDIDQLLRCVERLADADTNLRAAELDPSEFEKDGLAHAKSGQLRAMAGLTWCAHVTAERQRWRHELADQQG